MTRPFVIHAGAFDENAGGMIVLHRLCDLINRNGGQAVLWPFARPLLNLHRPLHGWRSWWRYRRAGGSASFDLHPAFRTPIASRSDLRDAIVVYPEIVDGNPLRSPRVVRWLLNKPGLLNGAGGFGPNDRFFYFQEAFDDPRLHVDRDHQLRVLHVLDHVYHQRNYGPRSGTCHVVRKGAGRPFVHTAKDSILVDGMSHQQMAEVFNRVEMCVSYDSYTMYSLYAALCGCISVVVPEPGVSIDAWYPDPADRYGLAYGFDNLSAAQATQPRLLARLKQQESEANASVERFLEKCGRYFP